jgi:cell division inhibitor SepF
MGVFDKFMNAIRINKDEDYDEDEFYDEEDDFEDEDDEDDYEDEKPKKGFFSRLLGKRDEEDDEDDEEEEEAPVSRAKVASSAEPVRTNNTFSRITPMRKRSGKAMEVRVIKPANMEETREIADTLLANCTVVLNLEGLDVEIAQRVIDFSSGACYTINGSLQKVSSYIFILTPQNVGISGDITDILNGSVPTMRNM